MQAGIAGLAVLGLVLVLHRLLARLRLAARGPRQRRRAEPGRGALQETATDVFHGSGWQRDMGL